MFSAIRHSRTVLVGRCYPIMDVDMRSVEMYRAFDQERSWDRALNGLWTEILDGAIRPILIG